MQTAEKMVNKMEWLRKEWHQTLHTQAVLQEGHGQWETVKRRSQQCCFFSLCVYSANIEQLKTSTENLTMQKSV